MSSELPLISLIIPVFNTEEYVQKCLDSIFGQTYKSIEIIIVNNGSDGNINDIVYNYRQMYPDRILKLVIHEKNIGTFHGRGSGMSLAEGKYFAFLDADDRVGVDYFYQMIHCAEETQSEIVVADLVHEDEKKTAFRYAVDPVRSLNFEIEGKEKIFDFYYSYAGRSYSMYGIWNKIYRRDLWDRCKPFIDAITEQFALCEDAEYTTIFFSQANKISNIHNQYYYHYIHSESASAGMASSFEKADRSIRFQGVAFRNMKAHLERIGLYKKYRDKFEIFRGFHQKCMLFHIENSTLRSSQKNYLKKYCNREFENDKPESLTTSDMFFTQHFVTQTNELEEIRERIVSNQCKAVSFDVFDTALLRRAWQPLDVFEFMTPYYQRVSGKMNSFSCVRVSAERRAREQLNMAGSFNEDVTLDSIYTYIVQMYAIDEVVAQQLKEYEIQIEAEVCFQRRITKELFDLALRAGKKVIFTSDSYLPVEVLELLLQKNGYEKYEKLYVSSQTGVTKVSGNMFRKIQDDFPEIRANEFFHIGDNPHSDMAVPAGLKWKTACLPKPVDVFCNYSNYTYAGQLFEMLYQGNQFVKFSSSLSLRTAIAVAANCIFDNPFVKYREDSDFNADPYHVGIMALGMYTYGFCRWLVEKMADKKQSKIYFFGKEMEWFYRKFKQVCRWEQRDFQVELLETEDSDVSIPRIRRRNDLYDIASMIEISYVTPLDLCKELEYCLQNEFLTSKKKLLEQYGIVPTKKFDTYSQLLKFLNLLHDEYFDESKLVEAEKYLQTDAVYVISGLNQHININRQRDCFHSKVYSLYVPAFYFGQDIEAYCDTCADSSYIVILRQFFDNPDEQDVGGKGVLQVMHKGAEDFMREFHKLEAYFKGPRMYRQMAEPLDYLIKHAKFLDRYIFATIKYDEDASMGDIWDSYARCAEPCMSLQQADRFIMLNPFQKLCYLLVVDHDRLRATIKRRLANHPRAYAAAKWIYRKFCNQGEEK